MTRKERDAINSLLSAWRAVQSHLGILVQMEGNDAYKTWHTFCDHMIYLHETANGTTLIDDYLKKEA